METINDFKAKAIKEYHSTCQQVKDSLTNIFGKRTFLTIMERVKTFEEACLETGRDPAKDQTACKE
jgi:hypothetical protein